MIHPCIWMFTWKIRSFEGFKHPLFCLMVLHSFVKINLLFRIMDPLKRKSPEFETSTRLQVGICVLRRFKSACASAQSDQSLSFSPEEKLDPWLPIERPIKTRMRRLSGFFDGRICQLIPFDGYRLIKTLI